MSAAGADRPGDAAGGGPKVRTWGPAAAVAIAAAGLYAWNAWTVPPLTGYDAGGHAGYVLTILDEGRLPRPAEGWSTFHPPLYYLLAAGVWPLLEPLGPRALVAGLRGIGALAWLGAIAVAAWGARRAGASPVAAAVVAGLVAAVPCAQLAATMIGNEALAAGLGALALPPLLVLQRDPGRARAAFGAALFCGLAAATKYSGLCVAAACAVPFLRPGLDVRRRRALAVGLATGAAIAGPVYLRNVLLAGTPFPTTAGVAAVRTTEDRDVLRPRRAADYLWLDPATLVRPSIHHVPGAAPPPPRRNPAMTNVWGLAYASAWYDAFGHRIPVAYHRDGVIAGPLLAGLGLVPTAVMLLGLAGAAREAVRSRGRSPDAPLVAIWGLGLGAFVAFTWRTPALASSKASYLLPLAVPGALLYARALRGFGPRLRGVVLAASATAAVAAAAVFVQGLWFPPVDAAEAAQRWRWVAAALPDAHIGEAVERLAPR